MSVDWRLLVGVPLFTSGVVFLAYRADKLRAEAGQWRVPESTLHLLEFVGGWPGAFLAQRRFRHKTAKTSYLVVYWAIVALHQAVAFDSLTNWTYVRLTSRFLRSLHG